MGGSPFGPRPGPRPGPPTPGPRPGPPTPGSGQSAPGPRPVPPASGPRPGAPAASGDAAETVARVERSVAGLAELDELPVGAHVARYDALHNELSEALASIDGV